MRIAVYGAGAVGGHVAAKLAAAGHELSVLARGPHLAAMQEKGLMLLHGSEKTFGKVRATQDPADLGAQDLVIVTLKANALGSVADRLGPLLRSDTAVVFAQNGIPWWYASGLSGERPQPPDLSRLDPAGVLKHAIKADRIIGAVIYSANDLVEPGVVVNHSPGNNMLVLGEADDRESSRIKEIRLILERSGISSPPTPDIRQVVWNKLNLNLATSTLCLLAGCTVGEMRADSRLAEVIRRIAAEGRAIAAAHGVDPDKAPPRPGGHGSGGVGHKPSMLQDYEAGRPMEIEAQLATPLAFARQAGVVTPTLDALIPLAAHKAAAKGLYRT